MAQYYSVTNQDDKNADEVSQFYPNLEDNQTVQYVIASDGTQSQVIGAQPVVVSSEQLMVVEGQGQPVIIDQSQVVYQPSSYVIQDTSGLDFQNNQQQVYYMTNTPPTQSVVVEQSITSQPLVLNHQIMSNSKLTVSSISTNCSTTSIPSAPVIQEKNLAALQQMRNQQQQQKRQNVVNSRAIQVGPQKVATPEINKEVQTFTGNANEKSVINNEDEEDLIQLADGRWVNYVQYKKALAHQKQVHERLAATMLPRRPKVAGGIPKPRPAKSKQAPRANRPSSFVEDQHFNEHKASPIKANMQQQFQDAMPQRHHINRAQESHNQYLIQPRPRDSKPQIQRPLPQFLHSSQIQNIIDSTPKNEEYSDSIRMLVLLDNGEQRLITFTLPKEACTIQEILEQVGVPFTKETPIQVSESNSSGLNYIVAVGTIPGFVLDAQQSEENTSPHGSEYGQQDTLEGETGTPDSSKTPPSPEPPKLIEGQLALCGMCGYLSEDFNRCLRCKRRLPENVKAIPAVNSNGKKTDPRGMMGDKRLAMQKTNGIPRMNLLPKKRPAKPKLLECETVVVSSDEEDDSDKNSPVKNVSEQLLEKLGNSITISPVSKEPSIVDIQKLSMAATTKATDKVPLEQMTSTMFMCRTIRIGSYRFISPEAVRIDSNGINLKVPHPKLDNVLRIIKIDNSEIVKVLISFQKSLPVVFYYLLPSAGTSVRNALDMVQGSDLYFDPLSEEDESHRRITLLPEVLPDECKLAFQRIYSRNGMFDELTYKEANDILIKTCPKDIPKTLLSYCVSEIKPILMYPPEGRGRITINTEDYMCLGQDQFLNDVIIDFYLKYLLLNMPKEKQDKVHIFSTFFYKRLTTKPVKASKKSQPTEIDPNLNPAQKRHSRVKTWTKNVNIFEKDFVVVPINENCHWFLAIICFPNMNGSHTMDGRSIKIEPKQSKKKKGENAAAAAALKEKKEQQLILCEDADLSDKDEAEGDDSELDSDDSEESPPTLSVENNSKRPPIKQPCILIFDSLAGASRSRVVATLRDYLTCEYKAKLNQDKIYTKDIIKGACPKVPQQTNFTDCGLYLLQYVEQFFKDPIKDYYIPIGHLKVWFDELIVTKKREDISNLIKSLMKESGKDLNVLPDINFPTLNGELVEDRDNVEKDDAFIDPDELMDEEEEEDDEERTPSCSTGKKSDDSNTSDEKMANVSQKSVDSVKNNAEFVEQTLNANIMKPELGELPKQSCKDTLSYLKAKRIIRHKNTSVNNQEGPESKKIKSIDAVSGI